MNTPIDIQGTDRLRLSPPHFGDKTGLEPFGQFAAVGAVVWLGVGAVGVWDVVGSESGERWIYPIFAAALLFASALTMAAVWSLPQTAPRTRLRTALRCAGLVIGAIALASTIVAWAGPLWMTTLGASLAVSAVAAPPDLRLGLATMAAGQLAGIAVTIGAIEAEIGQQDSYGDYASASGLGVATAAAGSALGLALLVRAARAGESSC